MADNVPVAIARGVMGGARAAPKNFSKEFPELMEIFKSQTSPKQRALMRNEAQALFESALASPNTIVRMPTGAIVQIPAGRAIPPNAQVLNKNPDDLRAIFPDEIRPYIPKTTSVPSGGSRPIPPAAPPSMGPFGPRPAPVIPTREPNLGLPLGAAGLAGTGGILAAQRSDIYAGGQRTPTGYLDADDDRAQYPLDPALVQRQALQNMPVYRGPAVDEVRSPPEPGPAVPYLDADDDRAAAFRESLGSVGPAGSLPMMARRGGGEGQYTAIIDPSILMLARERLMPYSMRGAEGRVSSESAPAASSARTGAAGPRAASSTSAESRPAGGFLSGMFKDPYEGMSSSRLMQLASERPDDPAMYFRADAALRRERPEMFEKKSEGGMARGGSAGSGKGGKDAAVMKALEIIHHMLSNR